MWSLGYRLRPGQIDLAATGSRPYVASECRGERCERGALEFLKLELGRGVRQRQILREEVEAHRLSGWQFDDADVALADVSVLNGIEWRDDWIADRIVTCATRHSWP